LAEVCRTYYICVSVDCSISEEKEIPNYCPIIINGEPIERGDCFKFLGTITFSDLVWENNTDAIVIKVKKAVLPAPTKDIRAEGEDSCSVLSFCY